MTLQLLVPPADTPVSLAEAKAWLRVDHADDDTLIQSLIASATGRLDGLGLLGRAILRQDWLQTVRSPDGVWLRLEMGPALAITGVSWVDGAGAEHVEDPAAYELVAVGEEAWVRSDAWPTAADVARPDAIRVKYECGMADTPANVPSEIKTAILLLVAHWYEHREAVAESAMAEVPVGVGDLIERWRHGYAA